jgi:hypothetical protein
MFTPVGGLGQSTFLPHAGDLPPAPKQCTVTDLVAGDVLALSKLIYQIGLELKSVPDSAPDYQDLLQELEALDRALQQTYNIRPGIHELKRLDAVRALASTCQAPLKDFLGKIQKFNKSLGPWNCGHRRLNGFGRGVQWSLMWKEEVKKLRAQLTPKLLILGFLWESQIIDSLTKAELDRARNAQEVNAQLSSQGTSLDRLEKYSVDARNDASKKHISLLDMIQSQSLTLTDVQSDIRDHKHLSEAHFDKQDAMLKDIHAHTLSSADQIQSVDTRVSALQQEVAVIKDDSVSIQRLMARMVVVIATRFSRLQHIAELITDLLTATLTMTKESTAHLLQLLREFKEIRQQLLRMERYLPNQMHYPMIQFRDAFNNVTPFPYHVFREWEGAKRMVAAIFVNRQGLHRVEMGQWFATHVGKGIRVDPRFWSSVLQPGDELSMTMIFPEVEAKEGVCPYPRCGADTSSVEIVRGGRYCPQCSRFAELSQNQPRRLIESSASQGQALGLQKANVTAANQSPKDARLETNAADTTGPVPFDAPEAPVPSKFGHEDIEEYYFIQVIQTALVVEVSPSEQETAANVYITVFVQETGQKSLCFRISPSTEVQDVKAIIRERRGIPENRQRLTFGRKHLPDDVTLSSAGVEHEHTIRLVQIIQPSLDAQIEDEPISTKDISERHGQSSKPELKSTVEKPAQYVHPPSYRSASPRNRWGSMGLYNPEPEPYKAYAYEPYEPRDEQSYVPYSVYASTPRTTSRSSRTRRSGNNATATDSPHYIYSYSATRQDRKRTSDSTRVYYVEPSDTDGSPVPARPRRRPTSTLTSSGTRKEPLKQSRVATDEDAKMHGIPPGYSLKNWDPTEVPIKLLGSVFDANSLGKWIYDWTAYHHKAPSPISDLAGELWLLLIKLAGKMKRAEETIPRIRTTDKRELVEDFIESGERIWTRFKKLLQECETAMLKTARKPAGPNSTPVMGKASGVEFVESIFGRDRLLERTEKVMTTMRLWDMRFTVNCEEILKHPTA